MIISNDLKPISIIEYPEEDFEPMPEGDKQRRNLSYTTEALTLWFESQKDVYVSGNLFIFYEENKPEKRIAPDTFVVFGMSGYDRSSYKIWEEGNKVPDFVLEITSKGTVAKDQGQNPLIYKDLGVKEYFQYDPTGEYLKPSLQGVRLEQGQYVEVISSTLADHTLSLHSEVLGLDLHLYPDQRFRFYDPISQEILRSLSESEQARFQAELERSFAQQAKQDAEAIADQERMGKEQAERKVQRLADRLKALGIDPDTI
jgi:Uma2 family endonuclease